MSQIKLLYHIEKKNASVGKNNNTFFEILRSGR